ncbi:MAG: D-alanyl-D-alanine carboxypeptidase family protein [Lachnospiraceae bacterium]
MNKLKRVAVLLLCALLVFQINGLAVLAQGNGKSNKSYWPEGPRVESASAIVMEATTGTILYGKNIHKKRYPASITKIMTTLLALEHCSLSETVTFSHDAVYNIEGTHIARDVGEQMSLEETLYGVMLASANECAYAVAEHVGGEYDTFINMMNQRAKELGCKDTHFNNPHGLPDEKHYTSAYDMALISREAIKNETFRLITGTKTYSIPPTNVHTMSTPLINHHGMLTAYKTSSYLYEPCIGGKTGYTNAARSTLVTFAEKNGMTLICVVMKSESPYHYVDTTKLLDYCFDNFQTYNVTENETTYSKDQLMDYMNFDSAKPFLRLNADGLIVLPKSADFSEAAPKINYDKAQGTILASLDYYYGQRYVGGTNIETTGEKAETFKFGNSVEKKENGEKRVVQIQWKYVFFFVFGVIILFLLIALGIFLVRNIYVIRYNLKVRRIERMRMASFRQKRKRRQRRRSRRR